VHTKTSKVVATGGDLGVYITNTGSATFSATATNTGDIQLQVTGSGAVLTVDASINTDTTTGTGNITLSGVDGVTVNTATNVTTLGAVIVNADTDANGIGSLTLSGTGAINSGNATVPGNVTVLAANVSLSATSTINSGAGNVHWQRRGQLHPD
jgi:hypothetical protein